MNKFEAERIHPMVWLTAMHGALSKGAVVKSAARNADEALDEFKTRFPVTEDDDTR